MNKRKHWENCRNGKSDKHKKRVENPEQLENRQTKNEERQKTTGAQTDTTCKTGKSQTEHDELQASETNKKRENKS